MWVARSASGSVSSNSTVAARRRVGVQRSDNRAGIVDTCVLRSDSRRRWNSAPSGQRDLLGAVPRRDERRALVTEERQGRAQRLRVTGRLDDERHPGRRTALGQDVVQILRSDAEQPEARHQLSSPSARLDSDDVGAGSLQQQAGEGAHGSEAEHHDALAEHRPGVQADLQRRLDEREQRGGPIVHGAERHDVGLAGDEQLLVGLEREDPGADRDVTSALLDDADAAVAVAERKAERAAQGADRLVEREVGIELATVGQHLGAGADARERRAHEHVAVAERRERQPNATPRDRARRTRRCARQPVAPSSTAAFLGHRARVSGRR